MSTAGADGSLRSWSVDKATGATAETGVKEHAHEGRICGLLRGNRVLYTCGADGAIRMWSQGKLQLVAEVCGVDSKGDQGWHQRKAAAGGRGVWVTKDCIRAKLEVGAEVTGLPGVTPDHSCSRGQRCTGCQGWYWDKSCSGGRRYTPKPTSLGHSCCAALGSPQSGKDKRPVQQRNQGPAVRHLLAEALILRLLAPAAPCFLYLALHASCSCTYAPLVHLPPVRAAPVLHVRPFATLCPLWALLLCCTYAPLVHFALCGRCCCAAPTLPWYTLPPVGAAAALHVRLSRPPLTGGMLCFPVFPELQALQAHGGEKVRCMAMGGNGVLYTGGDDHLIRAWSPHTLEPLPDFEPLRVSGRDRGWRGGGQGMEMGKLGRR